MMVSRNSYGWPWTRLLWLTVFGLVAVLVAGCGDPSSAQPAAPPAPPPPAVVFTPENGAKDVSPTQPITATVPDSRVVNAVLTNPAGEQVSGEVAPDGKSWKVGEPLGYDKTYTLAVTAQRPGGAPVTEQSVFNTVAPKDQTYVSMNPLDGETVGIGQPLAFYFSKDAPAPDKARAEEAIRIRTEPAVEGAFYWYNSRELHWRPEQYWAPGTKVTVNADVYGKDLGNGVYGQEDRSATINIGDSVILRADGASHQMSVEVNGAVRRTVPVSLGKSAAPSSNGPHVVTQKHSDYMMDSSTFGLPTDADGGYRTKVKWAVRISNSGEFLHAAPWSVAQQGHSNVSHGCINMSDAIAKSMFDLVDKGDIVEITNSGGPGLKPTDGFGDWQVPWSQWVQGNK